MVTGTILILAGLSIALTRLVPMSAYWIAVILGVVLMAAGTHLRRGGT